LFLLVNPLYDLLARRAIADIPCEALVLTATAFALRFWQSAPCPAGSDHGVGSGPFWGSEFSRAWRSWPSSTESLP